MNYVEKQLLLNKEQNRIKTLDNIAVTFLPRECYEKPEVILQTYHDYMTASKENEEAFEEVMNHLSK